MWPSAWCSGAAGTGWFSHRRQTYGFNTTARYSAFGNWPSLSSVLFQKLFGLDGSGTSGARGGDGLAIAAVLHVTARENAGHVGEDEVASLDVAVRIFIELAIEHFRVWLVADAEEHGAGGEIPRFSGLQILKLQ